jgi:diphthamide biosynthesis methyltransferase
MLYAYTNTGADEAKNQLNALMKRNIILTDRAEKMQNEDEIAKYSMIFYLPMFLGTGKVMLDMSVMFMIMFSVWGQFM